MHQTAFFNEPIKKRVTIWKTMYWMEVVIKCWTFPLHVSSGAHYQAVLDFKGVIWWILKKFSFIFWDKRAWCTMKTYFRFQNFISVWIVILMSKCNAGFVNWHLLKDAVVRNYIRSWHQTHTLTVSIESAVIAILYEKGAWIKGLQTQ